MVWVLTDDSSQNAYTNLDHTFSLFAVQVSSLWYIDAYMPTDRNTRQARLNGSWATKAEAVQVIKELTNGVDVSGY